jgi:hypothetical protein
MGKAAKNGLSSRVFYEMKGGQCEQDEDSVGEPGIQSEQMEAFWHMVNVQKLEDIEVEQV